MCNSGFSTKKEASAEREKIIAQRITNTFIVAKKQLVSEFLLEWLEDYIKVQKSGKHIPKPDGINNGIFKVIDGFASRKQILVIRISCQHNCRTGINIYFPEVFFKVS